MIILGIILALFCIAALLNLTHYKGWGNNNFAYFSGTGTEILCDVNLFSPPTNCRPKVYDPALESYYPISKYYGDTESLDYKINIWLDSFDTRYKDSR